VKKTIDWWSEYKNKNTMNLKSVKLPSFKYGLNILIKPDFIFDELSSEVISSNNIKIISDKKEVKIINGLFDEIIEFLDEKWEDQHSDNFVWHFHNLFSNSPILIHIPEMTSVNINIENIIREKNTLFSLFILADRGSKAKIIFNKSGENKANYSSELVRVITKENSSVELINIQKLPKDLIFFQNRKSMGEVNSEVSWLDIFIGGKYIRSETTSCLNNLLARVKNNLIYFAQDNQKYDFYSSAIHNSPETKSDLTVKGALIDQARALSRGLIKIMPSASNSEGYEKQEAIILSSKAEADAIPNLEIENNAVKCSHGSTVGRVDNEKLFYLMSRGLNEKEARNKIIEGYFAPIFDKLIDNQLANDLKEVIINSLNEV